MCEERLMKIKREMRHARRRTRRLHQIHNFIANPGIGIPAQISSSSESDSSSSVRSPPAHPPQQSLSANESIQCLQHVAARTIGLMHRNQEIQRRVEELKRETAAFVNSVINSAENQSRAHPLLMIPTPFQTPPTSHSSETSSTNYDEDSRSLPDVENCDANDSFDVELKPDFQFKDEPI